MRNRFAPDPSLRRKLVFGVLGTFSALGWGAFLLAGPAFLAKEVVVEGGKGIDPVEAKAAVLQILDGREDWRPWSPRQLWFVPEGLLEERLKTRWFAESVRVHVEPWNNIIRLIVVEQPNALLVKTPGQFLRVDAQGTVRAELDPAGRLEVLQRMAGRLAATGTSELIVELPAATESVAAGYRLPVPVGEIRAWLTLDRLLRGTQARPRYLRIEPGRVVLYDRDEVPVSLDPSGNLLGQIKGLEEYYARVGAKDRAKTSIDARIPGRLYVR